jgi:Zn2+/Cd2+-exporting ATPase
MNTSEEKKRKPTPEEEDFASLPWMIRFTIVCFVTLIAGWITEGIETVAAAIPWILYGVSYFSGGYYSVQVAYDSLKQRLFDVNFLMIIAAIGAALVGQPKEGAILMFLFSLSNTLETYAMGRTFTSVRALLDMTPKIARVKINDDGETKIIEVPVDDVRKGDIVVVRPGEQLPNDGVVVRGESAVDEASITGESMPAEKRRGSKVFAGTMNGNGTLELHVTVEAEDSTLARIVKMVEEAREKKAKSQDFTDRVLGQYYAMSVVGITLLVFAVPFLFLGWNFGDSFYRAITLMVVASPCALVISIPAALLSALASSARSGVLYKGGAYIEQASTIRAVAFDKTGTLTTGRPGVVAVIPFENGNKIPKEFFTEVRNGLPAPPDDQLGKLTPAQIALFAAAVAVEYSSEHPIAKAIVKGGEERGINTVEVENFEAETGFGARAVVYGRSLQIGKKSMFKNVNGEIISEIDKHERQGKTVVLIGEEEPWGLLAIADTIREEARSVVGALKKEGIEHVVLLTGDNEQVAKKLGQDLGVDEVFWGLLPQEKVETIKEMEMKYGSVAMVGDGVNDAPALASANVGIAMGAAGTDVALESADVLLMSDDLSRLPGVLKNARRTRRIVRQNLTFAFIVMVTLMILALFGEISLPLAVVGHEGLSANGLTAGQEGSVTYRLQTASTIDTLKIFIYVLIISSL